MIELHRRGLTDDNVFIDFNYDHSISVRIERIAGSGQQTFMPLTEYRVIVELIEKLSKANPEDAGLWLTEALHEAGIVVIQSHRTDIIYMNGDYVWQQVAEHFTSQVLIPA